MKKIDIKTIQNIIDSEIKWCKSNKNGLATSEEAEWFIKGLKQAKFLIEQAAKIDEEVS